MPPSESARTNDREAADWLRGDLDQILLQALRKEPERRYPSVEALAADLERYRAGEPVDARPATLTYRVRKFLARNRGAVAATALFVLLGVAYAVTVTLQADRLSKQRDRARTEAAKAEQVSTFLVDLLTDTDPYKTEEEGGGDLRMSTVLDRGAERIERLEDQPVVQAQMRAVIGKVYDKMGEFEEAEPLLDSALVQRRRLHQGPDSTVATSLHQLGLHHQRIGNYERADSLLREALAMRRSVLGPGHQKVAHVLSRLGSLSWYNLGNYAAADSFFHEALRIRQEHHDSAHVNVATSLNDLANLYHRQGDYDRAASYYRDALQMYRKLRGDHPNAAIIQSNFAALLRDQGKYAAAETEQRDALAMHRRLTGEKTVDVALGLGSLARIQLEQGHLAEADSLFERGLAMQRSFFEPPHPYLVRTLYHRGRLRLRQDRLREAQQLFTEVQQQAQQSLPSGHPVRANPHLGLGRIHLAAGRPAQAEPHLRKALSLRTKGLGPKNWQVAVAQGALGRCLTQQGRYETADSLLHQAHQRLQQKRPDDDPYLQQVQRSLVTLYEAREQPERASAFRDSIREGTAAVVGTGRERGS